MPQATVYFYREHPNDVPVLDWLRKLQWRDRRAFAKCVARIQRLAELGHELRRPEADYLRDGLYELRVRRGRIHYRLLYFFHGRQVAILVHALTKEGKVPEVELDRALRRKQALECDPEVHLYEED